MQHGLSINAATHSRPEDYNPHRVIHPMQEILAYECLWMNTNASFKAITELLAKIPNSRPSDFVPEHDRAKFSDELLDILMHHHMEYKINVLINGAYDYPVKLKDAEHPVEVLYYSGNIQYLKTRTIAIVGTRKPTDEGKDMAKRLARLFVKEGFTIASGLAQGIDTAAHTAAIEAGGRTLAVIGTPIDTAYPKENIDLQKRIAVDHLLVSQVPICRYKKQGPNGNRLFFPERNKTMSALSEATVIVEASDTSGTLIQAKAALKQGRKLFILDRCFRNKDIKWPENFLAKGAIRVKSFSEIKEYLMR